MIKICEIIWRRPGMSVADFQDHWLNRHGPIVARLPGLRRYVQSHPRPGGYRKGGLAFDGLAELWLDSKEALIAASRSPESLRPTAITPSRSTPKRIGTSSSTSSVS